MRGLDVSLLINLLLAGIVIVQVILYVRSRKRRECFHHAPSTGFSWIESRLIDTGMRKMFWCTQCGQTWFT